MTWRRILCDAQHLPVIDGTCPVLLIPPRLREPRVVNGWVLKYVMMG